MISAGHKVVVTSVKHETGITRDEWECVCMQIAKHCVALPLIKDADSICAHGPEEQGHGTTGAKGVSGDIANMG